jgi:hypothetical protein
MKVVPRCTKSINVWMRNEAGREMLNPSFSLLLYPNGCYLVVLKTDGFIANRFFNVQPFHLSSCQDAEPIHPWTKDNQKVVESSETHSAVPPAAIQVEASDDHDGFEQCNYGNPVKVLKQETKKNVALHVSSVYIDSRQSKRPIRQLEQKEKNKIEPIPTELAHSAFLSRIIPSECLSTLAQRFNGRVHCFFKRTLEFGTF